MAIEHPKRSPDRCPTHPGAMLRDIVVPALNMQKKDIAAALGISRQTLHDLLTEKQPVTPAMAVRLEAAFGTSATTWLRMQAAFDLWHAARETDTSKVPQLRAAS